MSRLNDLLRQLHLKDEALANDLKREVDALADRRAFGLNFERHVPEAVELPGRPVRRAFAAHRRGVSHASRYPDHIRAGRDPHRRRRQVHREVLRPAYRLPSGNVALLERALRDAANLSDDLFESELCGHGRGAFTGAVTSTRGLLEAAEDGTAYLDEVSSLSPATQAKFLRVLQEKTFRRLGGVTSHTFRARLRTRCHRFRFA